MFITYKKYQNNISIALNEGRKEGRAMALHELKKCDSKCIVCPPDWPKGTRKGTCTKCSATNVKVAKNYIEGGRDCYNCAQSICFGAAIRRMK